MINYKKIIFYAQDIFEGDAVGNHTYFWFKEVSKKYKCEIYAKNTNIFEVKKIKGINDINTNNSIIYASFSIYDKDIEIINNLKQKTILYFHGITNPRYLMKYDQITAKNCRKGLNQIQRLDNFDLYISNSTRSKNNFQKRLNKKIITIPPMDSNKQKIFKNNDIKKYNFYYSGRVYPHKNLEKLILLFNEIKLLNNNSKLTIIGKIDNDIYLNKIKEVIKEKRIDDITFTGYISKKKYEKEMLENGTLITLSKDEGYCLPVIEAFSMGKYAFMLKENAAAEYSPNEFIISSSIKKSAKEILACLTNNNIKKKQLVNIYNNELKKIESKKILKLFENIY